MTKRLWLAAGLALLAGISASIYFNAEPEKEHRQVKTLDQIQLPDLNGKQQSVSQWQGKVLLINFWATWCPPCREEIPVFLSLRNKFSSAGFEVVGVSIDSQFSHFAWRETPVNKGGIGPVKFPIVADINHSITQDYGIEHPAGVALRASFLIDKEGVVQHQVVNNLPLGRNIDEMLRLIDALQFTEEHGEVCPAGWQKGDDGMKPSGDGVASYLDANADKL